MNRPNVVSSPNIVSPPNIVSKEEWLAARTALLRKEKAPTRSRDALNAERRNLPWVRLEKEYQFDTTGGKRSLATLFRGRSQLIVNHFMLGPGWNEGCVGCSFGADHVESALPHLEQRDVAYVAVSRAPLPEIEAFKKRMGWSFEWVSSFGSDFNYDYHVSFTKEQLANGPVYFNYRTGVLGTEEIAGTSVFAKGSSGAVFHAYSCYARSGEAQLVTYALLDLLPGGRGETGPNFDLTDWVRHHDRYGAGGFVEPTGRFVPSSGQEVCCHDAPGAVKS